MAEKASVNSRINLKRLLKRLVDLVQSTVQSEEIMPDDELFIQYKATQISTNKLNIPTGATWEAETLTRKSHMPFQTWMVDFRKTEEFHEIITEISTRSNFSIEVLMYPIERFLIKATYIDSYEEELEIFLDDLEGKPPKWKIIAKMKGLVPKKTSMLINKNILIRQIKKEDLTYTSYASGLGGSFYMRLPHSIFEMTIRGHPPHIQHELDKIIALLTLYRVAAVGCDSYRLTSSSFLSLHGGTISSGKYYSNEPILILSDEDNDKLNIFINTFGPILKNIKISERPLTFIDISLRRYSDSVRLSISIEEKFLLVMMGLEALYLDYSYEARFRLSIRVSKIMELLDNNSSKVYTNMLKAYEFRSSYVHGSKISDKDKENANSMIIFIQDYLRKSLLLWLILNINTKKKKKNFLREVDASLIDPETQSILMNKIAKNKTYFTA